MANKDISKKEFAKLYIDKCWSIKIMAEHFRVSRTWLYELKEKYGIERKCEVAREQYNDGIDRGV